jgi:hypothetical protein
MRKEYLTVDVNLRIPWCAEHKSQHRKAKVVFYLAVSLPFVTGVAYVTAQQLKEPGSIAVWQYAVLSFAALVAGIALSFLVPRIMRLPGPLDDFGIEDEIRENPSMLTLRFANREYAGMFAEANDWWSWKASTDKKTKKTEQQPEEAPEDTEHE